MLGGEDEEGVMKNAAEFERLADAVLYHSHPRMRRDDLKGRSARSYESLFRLGLGSDDPTSTQKGVEQSNRIQIIRALAETKLSKRTRPDAARAPDSDPPPSSSV